MHVPEGVTHGPLRTPTAPAAHGRGPPAVEAPILRTEALTMRFGGLTALNGVSLVRKSVGKGRGVDLAVHGLLNKKSTLHYIHQTTKIVAIVSTISRYR